MAENILPTPYQLRSLLHYEPETGCFFWKNRPLSMFENSRIGNAWNSRFCGKEAFSIKHNHGYLMGVVNYKKLLAHRVAWVIHFGFWPKEQIDHINGIKTDNRIVNLREATHGENLRNSKSKAKGNLGLKGITFDKSKGLWQAVIMKDKKSYFLGRFVTPEMAHEAYCKAALALHGDFAKTI